jgi:hypothetical protein
MTFLYLLLAPTPFYQDTHPAMMLLVSSSTVQSRTCKDLLNTRAREEAQIALLLAEDC